MTTHELGIEIGTIPTSSETGTHEMVSILPNGLTIFEM